MMNPKIIVVVLLLALQVTAHGQVNFPLNAAGKIEISDVVVDSLKKEDLYALASNWFNSLSKTPELTLRAISKDSIQCDITAELEFPAYYQTGVFQKVLGMVTYKLTLSVKDNKYRYVYTDFVLHHYKQDRYYKSVPTGKVKPLEETEAKGWEKNWERCKSATNSKVMNQVADLKAKMIRVQTPVNTAKKLDW
jgi:hypothetical protein